MERASNSKSNVRTKISKMLLLLLPNATSSGTPLSPRPSPHRATTLSIIPIEARRRRSKKPNNGISSFDSTKEPNSPQVSCLGQVKKKNKKPNSGTKPKPRPNGICCAVAVEEVVNPPRVKGQKKVGFGFGFEFEVEKDKKINDVFDNLEIRVHQVPSLGQMRKFESGRGVLSDFDWTTTNHYSSTTFVSQYQSPKIRIRG